MYEAQRFFTDPILKKDVFRDALRLFGAVKMSPVDSKKENSGVTLFGKLARAAKTPGEIAIGEMRVSPDDNIRGLGERMNSELGRPLRALRLLSSKENASASLKNGYQALTRSIESINVISKGEKLEEREEAGSEATLPTPKGP